MSAKSRPQYRDRGNQWRSGRSGAFGWTGRINSETLPPCTTSVAMISIHMLASGHQLARQPDRGEHPDQARDDRGAGDRQCDAQTRRDHRAFMMRTIDNAVQCEADQDGHQGLESEHEGRPRHSFSGGALVARDRRDKRRLRRRRTQVWLVTRCRLDEAGGDDLNNRPLLITSRKPRESRRYGRQGIARR